MTSAIWATPPSRDNNTPHLDGPVNSQTTGDGEVTPEVLTSVASVEAPRITRGNRKNDLQYEISLKRELWEQNLKEGFKIKKTWP